MSYPSPDIVFSFNETTDEERMFNIATPEKLIYLLKEQLPNLQEKYDTYTAKGKIIKNRYIISRDIDMKNFPIIIDKEIVVDNWSIEGPDSMVTISNLNVTASINVDMPFLIKNIKENCVIKNIKFDTYNFTLFKNNYGKIQNCIFINGNINTDIYEVGVYNYLLEIGVAGVIYNNFNIIEDCSFKNINIIIKTSRDNVYFNNIKFKVGGIALLNKQTIMNCIVDNISFNLENIDISDKIYMNFSAFVCNNEGAISKININNIKGIFNSCICYENTGTIRELDIGPNIILNYISDSKLSCIKLYKKTYNQYGILNTEVDKYSNIYLLKDNGELDEIIRQNNNIACSDNFVNSIRKPTIISDQPVQPVESDQTTQPSQPDQPSQPTLPDQPNQPSLPDQPNQPTQPIQPDQPNQPTQPTQPDQPTQPTQPTQPDQPITTDKSKKNYGLLIGLPIGIISILIILSILIIFIGYKYNILSLKIYIDKLF
jgi:hypothetical protein